MYRRIVFVLIVITLVLITVSGVALSSPPDPLALHELQQEAIGTLEITQSATSDYPSFVRGKMPVSSLTIQGENISSSALAFMGEYGTVFGVSDPVGELEVTQIETDSLGMAHLTLQQVYQDVNVYHSLIKLHFGAKGRSLEAVSNGFVPGIDLPSVNPKIADADALSIARAALPNGIPVTAPELMVYPGIGNERSGDAARLAWMVELIDNSVPARNVYVVDAIDGRMLDVLDRLYHDQDRETYDAEHNKDLPGKLVRSEGDDPTGDTDADKCHDFTGATYGYFHDTHGRDSYDDLGATLICTVHYGQNYQNAFWNGEQSVYGDDMVVNDVVAHEWTHAVTEYTADLDYHWQSGALNESISDIFGAMVDRDDWLMGEDLSDEMLGGRPAIRDLSDPARLGQPSHTDDWVKTCSDHEGVHSNSGITNKAYFNIATAIGKEKAERIFFRMLVEYLQPTSSLEDARAAGLQSAEDIFGLNSTEYIAVRDGFDLVGLDGIWEPEPNDCLCSASALMGDEQNIDHASAVSTLLTLYRVRDKVLIPTETGQRYERLYYEHSGRITALLLRDSALRAQAVQILHEVTPGLDRLSLGDGSKIRVSKELTTDFTSFLLQLATADEAQGGGELANIIHREMERVNLHVLTGMTYDQAWRYINTPLQLSNPPLLSH